MEHDHPMRAHPMRDLAIHGMLYDKVLTRVRAAAAGQFSGEVWSDVALRVRRPVLLQVDRLASGPAVLQVDLIARGLAVP